ncbi:cytochrome c [Pararhodobacter sp.]|uniref:c-type cytochrome n=1 Tax=Pararhodobacter sp. TaxID=2127056 RepID=UPI002AFF6AAB|nr:cytochrome c [Pararhodobacter sp.]
MFRKIALIAILAGCSLTGAAVADEQADPNIAARQSYMDLLAYNLGVIGGMAQNRMPYDAEMAATAAANLHTLAMVDTRRMWADGTDNFDTEGTRALPAIWENPDDFVARFVTLQTATEAMMAAAGTDLASLQGAMGGLGGACGACHQAYREPQ